jgi:Leucine-rich repeat (LRR) protein
MSLKQEAGDEFLRRIATFIRNNEKSLADAGAPRRRRAQRPAPADSTSLFNPLGWFGFDATVAPPPKPLVLAVDTHRLFYVLMRLEALGIDVGTLDVQVDSPSRPMSYINIFPESDKSDTLSLASFRSSLSAVSGLSLGGGWWGRPEPPSVDAELKYIYSSFTKLPALLVNAPGRKVIAELANDSPNRNALPLDAFKNLQSLECVDIDPRTLLGWDRLAESLRSLKVKKSGLEDVSDIFIGAVVDDQARREGSTSRKRRRRIPRGPAMETSFYTTRLPETVREDADEEEREDSDAGQRSESGTSSPPPSTELSSLKWAFLKHLSLSDNALTFFPAESLPYLTSLTHLDLSSNLLVSVPAGLGALYNLVSLNLSDNMIDSVLGIYLNLGQVLSLNLSHNRLESICGLERLSALERVDLRSNLIDESAEIGRLATLPNITDVWVEGNPFADLEEGYRITCFDYFWKERRVISLDGTPPGFYEKRNLTVAPPEQMSSSRPLSTAYSPPVVAVGHNHSHFQANVSPSIPDHDKYPTPPTSANPSPHLSPIGAVSVGGRARRKKVKRIVELDGDNSDGGSSRSASHTRNRSDGSNIRPKVKPKVKKPRDASPPLPAKKWGQIGTLGEDDPTTPKASHFAGASMLPAPVESTDGASSNVASTSDAVKAVNTGKVETPRPAFRARHSRYQTEFIPSSNSFTAQDTLQLSSKSMSTSPEERLSSSTSPITPASLRRSHRGSATFSSKSGLRRARVSASVYEPPTSTSDGEGDGAGGSPGDEIRDNADAYRRRIEALKKDMGDGWLKVFSQSQMKSPSP